MTYGTMQGSNPVFLMVTILKFQERHAHESGLSIPQ